MVGEGQMKDDQLVFASRSAFRAWLAQNHQSSPGIWLVFGRARAGEDTEANDALEEALCFGWIDGQLRSLGADRYLKRFTPRPRTVSGPRNRLLAQELIKLGLMTPAGQAAIDQAQKLGNWESSTRVAISDEQISILTKAIAGSGKALTNLLSMSPSVQRTYAAFYLDAKKEETRKTRLERIIGRLKENKKPM